MLFVIDARDDLFSTTNNATTLHSTYPTTARANRLSVVYEVVD